MAIIKASTRPITVAFREPVREESMDVTSSSQVHGSLVHMQNMQDEMVAFPNTHETRGRTPIMVDSIERVVAGESQPVIYEHETPTGLTRTPHDPTGWEWPSSDSCPN